MNETIKKFAYPYMLVSEFDHWVVLVRPRQVTFGCAIIASRSNAHSFAELTPKEAGELPRVISGYEAAVSTLGQLFRVNYLALMMVDPNPHFHAIPRYREPIHWEGLVFADNTFPNPPDLGSGVELNAEHSVQLAQRMRSVWVDVSDV